MSTPPPAGPIVVGVVPTPEGHAALRHAGREALERRLALVVVDLSHDGPDAELDELRAELDAAGLTVDTAAPDPHFETSEHLLKIAQETDATMVVIGLRHRSRVGKFLLGSSAQRILLEADCPVLTVKAAADVPA